MLVLYNPESSESFYRDYYGQQKGNGLAVFRGATIQKGRGIGSLFSSILRGAMPLLKSGAKAVGKQLMSSGANVVNDLLDGKELKSSAVQNFSVGGKKLLSSFTNNLSQATKQRVNRKRKVAAKSVKKGNKRKRTNKPTNIFK